MSDQPMSQEEIDALLAGMSEDAAPPASALPAAGAEAAGSQASSAPAANGPVDQSELDALLAQLETGASSGPLPVQATADDHEPSAPLGQNDIDQILAELEQSGPGDGPLSQESIDALISSMPDAPPPVEHAPIASATAIEPAELLSQDGIDALLAGLDDPAANQAPAVAPAPAPAPAPVASAAAQLPEGKLDQDDIDSLLNSLAAEQPTGGAATVEDAPSIPAVPGGTSRGTLALTTEDLSALLTKHGAPAVTDTAEGMIDQGDIDALVNQLGASTGSVEAPKPSMTEQLARHDAEIDQLLAGNRSPMANAATMDAIDFKGMADRSQLSSTAQGGMMPAYTVNVPVLTPPELRGARYLLAAAVLLLSICAGTLLVVAGAVRDLGSELTRERLANLEPSDDYSADFAAARSRLASPDEDQVAKGVLFLQRLRKRAPAHDGEIGLVLAHHFRSHGAWKEAEREFVGVIDDPKVIGDDPRVLVDYADVLRNLHDIDGAKRHIYALLADETRWLAPVLAAQTVERNRRTLVDAHVLLARLLDGSSLSVLAFHDESFTAADDAHTTDAPHAADAHQAAHAPAAEGHH